MTPISRGLLFMALGMVLMSCMDAIIKILAENQTAPQILFFRALFGLLPIIFIAKMRGSLSLIKTKRPFLHLSRAVLAAISFLAFAIGVKDMSLANALAVVFSAPFFMVLFSALLIGEHIGIHRIGAMIFGFIGVIIVLQPDEGILSGGAPFMLITAAAYALTQILARKYSATENAVAFSFWATFGMASMGLILLPFYWVPLDGSTLIWCLGMGLFGGVAHYLMTEAVRIAPPTTISPMEYTALIWAAIFDWAFWSIAPESATLIGSLVIISSGVYILWREHKHKVQGSIPCTLDL